MKFYLVIRPSFIGTTIPVYYYTFADNESDAQHKIEMKWGEFDNKTQVKEINDISNIVIATDYFR